MTKNDFIKKCCKVVIERDVDNNEYDEIIFRTTKDDEIYAAVCYQSDNDWYPIVSFNDSLSIRVAGAMYDAGLINVNDDEIYNMITKFDMTGRLRLACEDGDIVTMIKIKEAMPDVSKNDYKLVSSLYSNQLRKFDDKWDACLEKLRKKAFGY